MDGFWKTECDTFLAPSRADFVTTILRTWVFLSQNAEAPVILEVVQSLGELVASHRRWKFPAFLPQPFRSWESFDVPLLVLKYIGPIWREEVSWWADVQQLGRILLHKSFGSLIRLVPCKIAWSAINLRNLPFLPWHFVGTWARSCMFKGSECERKPRGNRLQISRHVNLRRVPLPVLCIPCGQV